MSASAIVAAMSSTLLQPFRIKPSPLAGPISTPRLVAFAAAQPPPRRRTVARSPLETRATLVAALTWQASTIAQRAVTDLAGEIGRYAFPRRSDGRNIEEALMSASILMCISDFLVVPDLETVKFKLLKKGEDYDIREVQTYFVAETKMAGSRGFDFFGASEAFNVLGGYLFGKNTKTEAMEMTTPVYTRKADSGGEKMDMTTPVITKKSGDNDKWMMSFVMPSKYGSNLPLPVDSHVKIREVPSKIMATIAFSGFVTDDEVRNRESKLREALKCDPEYRVKEGAAVEVAQFNPPFTLPFTRRNELSLEVERKNL